MYTYRRFSLEKFQVLILRLMSFSGGSNFVGFFWGNKSSRSRSPSGYSVYIGALAPTLEFGDLDDLSDYLLLNSTMVASMLF